MSKPDAEDELESGHTGTCPECESNDRPVVTYVICNDFKFEVERFNDLWIFTCDELNTQTVALTWQVGIDDIEGLTEAILFEAEDGESEVDLRVN